MRPWQDWETHDLLFSDGGGFDLFGIYAVLRRQVSNIMVFDCNGCVRMWAAAAGCLGDRCQSVLLVIIALCCGALYAAATYSYLLLR